MSNDLIYIYDHTTGKEITRELTDAEQAQRDAQVAEALIFQKQKQAEIEAKQTKHQEVLAKLGLSVEEAQALLG